MVSLKELEKYESLYSVERLSTFIYDTNDTMDDVINHYRDNIQISQALYPDLCTLEVILRNAINTVLKVHLSETWIEDEINKNTFLEKQDHAILINAYQTTIKECKSSKKEVTEGKIIANLNFGFWTNLCAKKYSIKIWNRMSCFKGVFVNYPNMRPEIAVISKKLYLIRKLRNRVFHYEQIFRYPEKTLNLYNLILEVLSYLPHDDFQIIRKTSSFLFMYDKLTKQRCKK